MKIVVIGGTGLIGSKTVAILRQGGHEVIAAAPESGVNSITGEGLKETLAAAQVVIDLANSPFIRRQGGAGILRDLRAQPSPAGGRSGRPAPRCAVHRRYRPERQWLFPRQGRPRETDRGLRRPLHHYPLDPVPGISSRHRRFRY